MLILSYGDKADTWWKMKMTCSEWHMTSRSKREDNIKTYPANEWRRYKLVIKEEVIQQVSDFEYLGTQLSDLGYVKEEVKKQSVDQSAYEVQYWGR